MYIQQWLIFFYDTPFFHYFFCQCLPTTELGVTKRNWELKEWQSVLWIRVRSDLIFFRESGSVFLEWSDSEPQKKESDPDLGALKNGMNIKIMHTCKKNAQSYILRFLMNT